MLVPGPEDPGPDLEYAFESASGKTPSVLPRRYLWRICTDLNLVRQTGQRDLSDFGALSIR